MILTYKIKHNADLSEELIKAYKVALIALKTKSRTSKDVKHIGLKAAISNQVLKKYSSNRRLKKISSVPLIVPAQAIKFENSTIVITCLKMMLHFEKDVRKINQIEFDRTYAYISCCVDEAQPIECNTWFGIDRNTTGHALVAADPKSGKVFKLGKESGHISKKYKYIRRCLQKKGKHKDIKRIKNKQSRKTRDLNHKISREIINEAIKNKAGLVLEDLKGIRGTAKVAQSFKYALNSWPFFQLNEFIEYKAKLHGIPVVKIDPRYTSQQCSRCGLLGERRDKIFKCSCGHVENADVNASFVISLRHQGILRSPVDRDTGEGRLARPPVQSGMKGPNTRTPLL